MNYNYGLKETSKYETDIVVRDRIKLDKLQRLKPKFERK